jgi:hypothetical protein
VEAHFEVLAAPRLEMTRDRSTTTFDHIKGFTIVKKWIKLLRVYDGKPVGEIYEVDEAIARALVAGGVAEDATATADGLLAQTQTAELRAQMEGYTRAIADTFRAGVEEIRAARPDLGTNGRLPVARALRPRHLPRSSPGKSRSGGGCPAE